MRKCPLGVAVPLLALVLVPPVMPAARGQGVSGDLGKMQGRWWARVALTEKNSVTWVYTISGDKLTVTTVGSPRQFSSESRIVLNEAVTPRTIELADAKVNLEETAAEKKFKGKTEVLQTKGIYKIEGDAWTCIFNYSDRPLPTSFTAKLAPGQMLINLRRGDPPLDAAGKAAAKKKTREEAMANRLKPQELQKATILAIDNNRHEVTFQTSDGEQVRVGSKIGKAYDAAGQVLSEEDEARILKAGNVVNVRTAVSLQGHDHMYLVKIELVQGELLPAKPGRKQAEAVSNEPGAEYHGAVIAKLNGLETTIMVDGKPVLIGRTNAKTVAIDLQGNQLPVGSQARLLRVGNKVDITLFPQSQYPRMKFPIIATIKLLEGALADPVQYGNSPPVRK